MAFLSYPFFHSDDFDFDNDPLPLLTTRRPGNYSNRNRNNNNNRNRNSLMQNRGPSSSLMHNFSPNFDVRESQDAYHLDGELPGIDQKDIEIEFSDPHTMVVKGHVTRNYEHSNADDDRASAASSVSPSRQATVEEAEDDDDENGGKVQKKRKSSPPARSRTQPQYKYWVSERSSGSFHRTFNFPVQVDQDAVKASLRNGVLAVHVPKQLTKKPLKKILIE